LNHITNPQSGQRGGRGINIDASRLNQGGGGGTGFREQPAGVDGTSKKTCNMPRQIFPAEDWTDCTLYHKKSELL